jgi:hypothetical protein
MGFGDLTIQIDIPIREKHLLPQAQGLLKDHCTWTTFCALFPGRQVCLVFSINYRNFSFPGFLGRNLGLLVGAVSLLSFVV